MNTFIHSMNIEDIDLNLMPVFSALMRHQSVSRAAEHLHLSQPAVSNALRRLRVLFDDMLFVRNGSSMEATDKARSIAHAIENGLQGFARAFSDEISFEPHKSERHFMIACNDDVECAVIPALMKDIAVSAPSVHIRTCRLTDTVAQLQNSVVDIVIGRRTEPLPRFIQQEPCYTDRYVSLYKERHSLLKKRPSLSTWLSAKHLVITPTGGDEGRIDHVLSADGLQRTVTMRTHHFMAAPIIVASTDLVVTVPERVADIFADVYGLRKTKPPFNIPPIYYTVACHANKSETPAIAWMRKRILACMRCS